MFLQVLLIRGPAAPGALIPQGPLRETLREQESIVKNFTG